jgi:hypothetical protein
LAECTLSDQLQDLKVLGAVVFLVDFMEVELEMDLACDLVTFSVSGFQLEPTVIRMLVLDKVGAETDVTEEGFTI